MDYTSMLIGLAVGLVVGMLIGRLIWGDYSVHDGPMTDAPPPPSPPAKSKRVFMEVKEWSILEGRANARDKIIEGKVIDETKDFIKVKWDDPFCEFTFGKWVARKDVQVVE